MRVYNNTNLEEIPPYILDNSLLLEELRNNIAALQVLYDKKTSELKKAPPGTLLISKSHNSTQYYQVLKEPNTKKLYLSKKDIKLCKALAQKKYNSSVAILIKDQIKQLQKIEKTIQTFKLLSFLKSVPKKSSDLTTPISLKNSDYVKSWKEAKYTKSKFLPDTPELYTATGLRVRSKSEILIADTLTRLSIPFQYEYPVTIKDNHNKEIIFHPDFLCLNLRTRKEFLWEHFGMMDNEEYAQNAVKKQSLYIKNDYIPGKNLILTMETQDSPINTKILEKIIQEYLM